MGIHELISATVCCVKCGAQGYLSCGCWFECPTCGHLVEKGDRCRNGLCPDGVGCVPDDILPSLCQVTYPEIDKEGHCFWYDDEGDQLAMWAVIVDPEDGTAFTMFTGKMIPKKPKKRTRRSTG